MYSFLSNCRLRVNNSNATAVQGTIRIFLVPMLDEMHLEYSFDDGRVKVFELDRFVSNCKHGFKFIFLLTKTTCELMFQMFWIYSVLPGSNRVVRQSTDSSLTISYDRTFPMQLDGNVLLVYIISKNDWFTFIAVVDVAAVAVGVVVRTKAAIQIDRFSIHGDECNITTSLLIYFDYIKPILSHIDLVHTVIKINNDGQK